jgi:hypothetical protein
MSKQELVELIKECMAEVFDEVLTEAKKGKKTKLPTGMKPMKKKPADSFAKTTKKV